MTTLLRCVKSAEDTSGRGEAASEAAIEAIGQQIATLNFADQQEAGGEVEAGEWDHEQPCHRKGKIKYGQYVRGLLAGEL